MNTSNTATSLLAAGALSLAGTAISFGESTTAMSFSSTSWSGGDTTTLSDTIKLTDSTAYESWTISFTYSYTANTCTSQWGTAILATGSDAYDNDYSGGFQLFWYNGTSSDNTSGVIYFKYSADSNKTLLITLSDYASTSYTLKFTISYNYSTSTLTATVAVNNETTTTTTSVTTTSTVAFTQLTTAYTGTDTSISVPDNNSISGLSGYVTLVAVPEPSTFGLLAGLGALALVASRRRRRRTKRLS